MQIKSQYGFRLTGYLAHKRLVLGLLVYSSAIFGQEGFIQDPFDTLQHLTEQSTNHTACPASTADDQAWTLLAVINQALCANPQTHQAYANALFQAGQLGIAEAAYLPSLTLNTTVSRSMNSSSSSLQVSNISSSGSGAQPVNRFTPVVTLNYLLYNFGSREAQLQSAEKTLQAANWTHNAVLQSVMFAAIQAYYQVFASQSAAEASVFSENASNLTWTAAQKRHEVGSAALVDVLLAETGWAQAKLNRQKTEGDAKVASGVLANVLGFQADYLVKLSSYTLPIPNDEQHTVVQQLIDDAKAMRPDLAAAEASLQAAEANVHAAEAGHLPSINLIANYGYNHTSIPSDTQSWTLGMQVSVPLFTGFNTTYQIRSSKAQLELKRANLDQLQQSVSLDVWRAYQLLNTAHASFSSSEHLLTSALQSEQVALGRYQAGAGTIMDVLNAQAALANARLQLIQAHYGWLTQKAQLAQALGQLDFSTFTEH